MTIGGDETQPQRRRIPAFPWDELRYILTLGGEYSPDTSPQQVPMTAHRHGDGIRGQVIKRAAYGPVMECIGRAFGDNAKRHKLFPVHWRVFMACEVGLVQRPDRRGLPRWVVYRPERPDAVMPDHEAAVAFGVATGTIREYLRVSRRAVEDEWEGFHSGYEAPREEAS